MSQESHSHLAAPGSSGTASKDAPLHTPGPWDFYENRDHTAFYVRAGKRLVLHTSWHPNSPTYPTKDGSLANVILASAAPDLLSALIDAYELLSKRCAIHDSDYHIVTNAAAAIHRAAHARTTGGAVE